MLQTISYFEGLQLDSGHAWVFQEQFCPACKSTERSSQTPEIVKVLKLETFWNTFGTIFLCLFYVWEQDLMRKHCRNKNLSSVFHGCHEDQLTSDARMHIRAPAVPDNNDDKIINSLNLFWINAFVSNSYFHYRQRKIIERNIKSTQKQVRY